jgi:hypothetical protein
VSFRHALHPRPVVHACLMLASLGMIACGSEQLSSPQPGKSPLFAAAGKKKPTIAGASGPSILVIGGDPGTYLVSLSNQTSAIVAGVSLQASIEQMGGSRLAANIPVTCASAPTGVLPVGGCGMSLPAVADNGAVGSGTLTPGDAKLVITLVQTATGSSTVLDSRTLRISLAALRTAPYISGLTTSFTKFVVGVGQDYTVTLTNPTSTTQSIVTLQASFVQNGVTYAGGGTNAQCPVLDLNGELPPGDCTFNWHTSVFSPPNGPVSGKATWRLELLLTSSPGNTVLLDFREVPVTIQ